MSVMYEELAAWWPLMSAVEDYAEEAAFFLPLLKDATQGGTASLLELGSGGGHLAAHMKDVFAATTLVEPANGMRAVSSA
ncbi:MAG: class I SAM-dependent methyltransferase [Anaerolineae bacterium]|nr:class I SAM-dependent methyltransferase [Anaerolineae bacterium]